MLTANNRELVLRKYRDVELGFGLGSAQQVTLNAGFPVTDVYIGPHETNGFTPLEETVMEHGVASLQRPAHVEAHWLSPGRR